MKRDLRHSSSKPSKELSIPKELSVGIYLSFYKQLIDQVKPYFGQATVDYNVVREVMSILLRNDVVVDITKLLPDNVPRTSIRAYLSSASKIEPKFILDEIVPIITDPMAPTYFKGYRTKLLPYLVDGIHRKAWGMGDVIADVVIKNNELDVPIVLTKYITTIRLRSR